ncbi:F-box/kelch-repeat protein-like protein [Tanacetum coccineum]
MCFLTLLHAPWHVPWRPAVTGMTVEERRGKSAAISPAMVHCLAHSMTRPVSTIGGQGLILVKSTGGVPIRLDDFTNHFKLYVAGGMSEAANGGATSYEPKLEVFNSKSNKWTVMGSMPIEFAVRLTVWTPNESVYANGVVLLL